MHRNKQKLDKPKINEKDMRMRAYFIALLHKHTNLNKNGMRREKKKTFEEEFRKYFANKLRV